MPRARQVQRLRQAAVAASTLQAALPLTVHAERPQPSKKQRRDCGESRHVPRAHVRRSRCSNRALPAVHAGQAAMKAACCLFLR